MTELGCEKPSTVSRTHGDQTDIEVLAVLLHELLVVRYGGLPG